MTDTLCTGTTQGNTAEGCRQDMGQPILLVLCKTKEENTFADHILPKDIDNWETLINATESVRAYPITVQLPELADDEQVLQDTGNNSQFQLSPKAGVDKFQCVGVAGEELARLASHTNGKYYVYVGYSGNYIVGKTSDGTKFEPVLKQIFVAKKKSKNGEAQGAYITMVSQEPVNELLKEAIVNLNQAGANFSVTDLKGIMPVNLTVISKTTSQVVVEVTSMKNTGVAGLVVGDFKIKTNAGANVSITTCTPDATIAHRYTLAATLTAGTYLVYMTNQPNATTMGYEYNGEPVSFVTT